MRGGLPPRFGIELLVCARWSRPIETDPRLNTLSRGERRVLARPVDLFRTAYPDEDAAPWMTVRRGIRDGAEG